MSLNDYVANFSPYAAIRIKHTQQDADIEHIQKLHDMIWNELPYEKYFEVASMDREGWGDVSVSNIASDMLDRLKKVENYSGQLFDRCEKGQLSGNN